MKKQALLKQIRTLAKRHGVAFELLRQGKHEIWSFNGQPVSIPRHREIAEGTAENIIDFATNTLNEED